MNPADAPHPDSGAVDSLNIDTMTLAEFEHYLPHFFAAYNGRISDNPRFAKLLAAYPDCAALVRDLEYIAETARNLLEPADEPSDAVWSGIQSRLQSVVPEPEPQAPALEPKK